ncbi:MAG: hypothetical protein ACO3ZW_07155 [Opitutales bacterium]
MTDQKLRRKSFLKTVGAVALGWLGIGAVVSGQSGSKTGSMEANGGQDRVRRDPRSVPCAGRTL